MSEGTWKLWDDAASIDDASRGWTSIAKALDGVTEAFISGSKDVVADWEGQTAESYEGHRKTILADLDEARELADKASSATARIAGTVRIAQGHLDQSWATVAHIPHQGSPSGDIRFEPESPEDGKLVTDAITRASELRTGLDRDLSADRQVLIDTTAAWRGLATSMAAIAESGQDPFHLPADVDSVGMINVDGKTYINTGSGDDVVTVGINPLTGKQVVTVNGQMYDVPPGNEIVIRAGEGNDEINVPQGTNVDLTLLGGRGEDKLHGGAGEDRIVGGQDGDKIFAGEGNDQVSGGTGRDYIDGQGGHDLATGAGGDDTVYGLGGNDRLAGGSGRDYLEGADGDDVLVGGDDADILSGGDDNDRIHGGAGDDVTYSGRGTDTTYGGSGDDTSNDESGDTNDSEHRVTVEIKEVPDWIKIEGSPEFVARTRADLEMLAASPTGQQMLANFQKNHDDSGILGMGKEGLTISEYVGDNNKAHDGAFGGNRIEYNPSRDVSTGDRPPVVGLYHEMAHVYDYMNDTFEDDVYEGDDAVDRNTTGDPDNDIKVGERQAVGLPIDHDDDPSTPEIVDPDHPSVYTENGLREEFHWDPREHYRG
ncbi:M91 family zinc metallopeptidase [Nocardioides sp. NPDC101246]|uniref:M91 family zinc metallopeptidase n=1 Tax=Nocardioides sp. NPDC101246 TaxID=3364336 RepID=UPI00380EDD46